MREVVTTVTAVTASLVDSRLTTLAPDIVAAILDEFLPDYVSLFDLALATPLLWDEQQVRLCL